MANTKDMKKKLFTLGSKISLPQPVTDWAESLKTRTGVFATTYGDRQVYLIATGEQRTGGYRVVATADPMRDDTVIFRIESPKKSDFVIQIITYPYEVILAEKGTTLHFLRKEKGAAVPVTPVESHPPTD